MLAFKDQGVPYMRGILLEDADDYIEMWNRTLTISTVLAPQVKEAMQEARYLRARDAAETPTSRDQYKENQHMYQRRVAVAAQVRYR
ncbi:MAG: hypothetical protein HOE83_00075 [Alphaproteobacteria bacterium]|jgi:hypothetical protein|nr:hypothetical protein [Alphaproteobacteria bacterium]